MSEGATTGRKRQGSSSAAGMAKRARAMELIAEGTPIAEAAAAVGMSPRQVRKWAAAEVKPAVEAKLAATIGGVADGAMRAHKLLSDNGERLAQVIADAACGELNDRNGMPVEDPQMVNARVNAAVRGLTFVVPQKSELDHKLPPADETLARIMAVLDARRNA